MSVKLHEYMYRDTVDNLQLMFVFLPDEPFNTNFLLYLGTKQIHR